MFDIDQHSLIGEHKHNEERYKVVIFHFRLLDVQSFGIRRGSPNNSYPGRKIVSSYGSVPPYTGSYNQSVESQQSPLIRGTTPPLLFPRAPPSSNRTHRQQSPIPALGRHHITSQSPLSPVAS